MTEETRMILERLDMLSQDIKETKAIAIEARDAALEAKTIALEAKEIATKALEAVTEVKAIAMGAVAIANETKAELSELKKEVAQLRSIVEHDLRKQIQIIGEGHDFLKMKLDMAINMEKERERMWLEILSLRMDMKKVKEKIYAQFTLLILKRWCGHTIINSRKNLEW